LSLPFYCWCSFFEKRNIPLYFKTRSISLHETKWTHNMTNRLSTDFRYFFYDPGYLKIGPAKSSPVNHYPTNNIKFFERKLMLCAGSRFAGLLLAGSTKDPIFSFCFNFFLQYRIFRLVSPTNPLFFFLNTTMERMSRMNELYTLYIISVCEKKILVGV